MRAKEGVLDLLNAMLTIELTAINQYFVQAAMFRAWGYDRLAEHVRALSLDEMKDAAELIDHILYLEGIPNMQRLGRVAVGENVPECLQLDLETEREAVQTLVGAITHCTQVGDFTTRKKFEAMIEDEETHVDWFETQLDTIGQVGIENYLAQQIH
ncbi:MAG: bacterioferritin [Chloroflexi bacterium]|nr:bacterioferritin [Chloroflexota bacterium]